MQFQGKKEKNYIIDNRGKRKVSLFADSLNSFN